MSTASSSLRSLLTGRWRSARAVPDPADMGTCFGLEMTLDEPPADAPPPASATRPWWQRLSRRRVEAG
jgi:hypothetical protein